ncbi:hypothetical protein MD484_g8829, partial [Candolleomyces efflorescens]
MRVQHEPSGLKVRKSATILELLTRHCGLGDAFLILDLDLRILSRIGQLDLDVDGIRVDADSTFLILDLDKSPTSMLSSTPMVSEDSTSTPIVSEDSTSIRRRR